MTTYRRLLACAVLTIAATTGLWALQSTEATGANQPGALSAERQPSALIIEPPIANVPLECGASVSE
jgi:hypothetical protein